MARPMQPHKLRFGQSNLFRPRHAPVVVIAVPPVAAAPIPQIPDAPAVQDLPLINTMKTSNRRLLNEEHAE
ncbi:hypothetical protein Clacol_007976 [Clathrus columnatus]|uniref:Uncharacterized protein n=1 Tax=Clathrus columnatus TaxID=1419009 RepID=A0AAV5AP82_9AGAM|nr:hypothetical protein Clacol_007976 [Clathrus columnatus]